MDAQIRYVLEITVAGNEISLVISFQSRGGLQRVRRAQTPACAQLGGAIQHNSVQRDHEQAGRGKEIFVSLQKRLISFAQRPDPALQTAQG